VNGEGLAEAANLFTNSMIILAIVFLVMASATDPFPRPRGRRAVAQRAALDAEVRGWKIDQHDKVVRWLDHAALSKATIAESAGERHWFYRDQDMHADGWPLFFTRSASARGALAKEAQRYASVQDRTVPAGPRPGRSGPVAGPGVPIAGSAVTGRSPHLRYWPEEPRPPLPPDVQRRYNAGAAVLMFGIFWLIVVVAFRVDHVIGWAAFVPSMILATILFRRANAYRRRKESGREARSGGVDP